VRRGTRGTEFWIPACAGMTHPKILTVPAKTRPHAEKSYFLIPNSIVLACNPLISGVGFFMEPIFSASS
jgi:hypothetical protein